MRLPFVPHLLQEWLPPDRFFQTVCAPESSHLRDALSCTSSLTHYLEQHSGQTVKIRLDSQEPVLEREESSIVWQGYHTLPLEGTVLSRNVWLVLAGRERLFAHSEVAIFDLSAEERAVIERGEEPLGSHFLERGCLVARSRLELTGAIIPDLAHRLDQESDTLYWCRRSLFHVNQGIRARIFEIYLPPLLP